MIKPMTLIIKHHVPIRTRAYILNQCMLHYTRVELHSYIETIPGTAPKLLFGNEASRLTNMRVYHSSLTEMNFH